MTIDSTAIATARRNLAQRIGKLITKLERETREPTPWEAHFGMVALQHLEFERYPVGEEEIFRAAAEHIFNTPVSPKVLPPDAHKATTAELRARLESLYEGA